MLHIVTVYVCHRIVYIGDGQLFQGQNTTLSMVVVRHWFEQIADHGVAAAFSPFLVKLAILFFCCVQN